ncbi:MAG: hypothetical protein UW95_C0006G0027 [Parcubacteria group bacterium GW2011_GWC1_45_14]|nr:MAG: hypothetical protein UW87_C0001G0007 [Candidatus Moranbacteria bacterium GW2011_GWC2_45_10]KKT94962.1 MAG: hypothetical protein UW95_C0006G0027 [Parcubacteria group bacterium GW2011_GWC1_45_14]
MFDVRPVDKTGNLDWEKINRVEKIAKAKDFATEYNVVEEPVDFFSANLERDVPVMLEGYESDSEKRRIEEEIRKREELELRVELLEAELSRQRGGGRIEDKNAFSTVDSSEWEQELQLAEKIKREEEKENERIRKEYLLGEKKERRLEEKLQKEAERREKKMRRSMRTGHFTFGDIFGVSGNLFSTDTRKAALVFVFAGLLVVTGIGGVSFAYKGIGIKGNVLGVSQEGYESLTAAISEISNQNFEGSSEKFTQAFEYFSEASTEMDRMGALLNEGSRFFPYISKISSGKNILEAGRHLSLAGGYMNEVVKEISVVKNPLTEKNEVSFLELFKKTERSMEAATGELNLAHQNVEKVKIDDLPEEMRDKFLLLRQQLPRILEFSEAFLKNSDIFADLLGGNGPRKYLFLFQNNNEMRATGGFIGSYGLLDISNGHVKNFFIDGIFNPDGQLTDKIVPPKPIQKISAAWSLHDSNWFPNFPTSAKEAILFYEKTGGPTVDGVITFTPVILQKLLEITGPIEMEEYDVVLDSENFIEQTQYEVEEGYDKEENRPKKILSDLAPMVLDRIVNSKDPQTFLRSAQVFLEGLGEKHILIYSENKDLQEIISQKKWSGEILDSKKDYLSVINTNINGYKTDGIIEEKISHKAEISEAGSIVNTVSVTRKHNGGNSDYEWWNKVNANYMRVYVPEGSQLLSVEGQTREINEPPLDYEKLGFKKDKLVQREEESVVTDENTGTRIYKEDGKTVFANWTYVSPQETMTITYKYVLPFKLFPALFNSDKHVDSYSLVAQKQAGSVGSDLVSEVTYPDSYGKKWSYPDNAESNSGMLRLTGKLNTDKFMGVVFEKK